MDKQETQRCGSCKLVLPCDSFSPSYRGKTGTWCRKCFADYNAGRAQARGTHEPRACAWCQESYVPKQLKAVSLYCSRDCKTKARNAVNAKRILEAKPVDRWCMHCGGHIAQERHSTAVFCSEKCNSAAHNVSRKVARRAGLQKRSELLNRAVIGDRDGWRCGICGGRIKKELRWPDPMCPSIDHVVPLSQGGGNEPSNLRVTHLQCNVRRSDKGGGEQLALH